MVARHGRATKGKTTTPVMKWPAPAVISTAAEGCRGENSEGEGGSAVRRPRSAGAAMSGRVIAATFPNARRPERRGPRRTHAAQGGVRLQSGRRGAQRGEAGPRRACGEQGRQLRRNIRSGILPSRRRTRIPTKVVGRYFTDFLQIAIKSVGISGDTRDDAAARIRRRVRERPKRPDLRYILFHRFAGVGDRSARAVAWNGIDGRKECGDTIWGEARGTSRG